MNCILSVFLLCDDGTLRWTPSSGQKIRLSLDGGHAAKNWFTAGMRHNARFASDTRTSFFSHSLFVVFRRIEKCEWMYTEPTGKLKMEIPS
jgi:hypothetical protein